ncbi:phosphatase PAP2 family protein [Flavobacterium caeni]|uniref:Membrane-associated phospholipid phosphatase n=1 Tax=Flavobacterium caeni TaxID=490189 RepID=A0A1G5GED0_9FLAO|nr:phosphatase PAP2 family protein [Flavobacterium caeni]SCY49925.1 Membrane-associated phospholipid phosphatase [Flavobacterium caeni]
MLRLFFSFAVFLYGCAELAAQDSTAVATDSVPTRWEMLKYDGLSVVGGVVNAYTAPLRWEKDDWLGFGGVAIGTGILWATDESTSDYFINQGHGAPEWLKDTGFYFGKPLYNYGITGGVYAVGLITKNEKIRKTGVLLISSATAAGVLQTVLKSAVGRARPTTGVGASSFKPFNGEEAYHSFPSGHAILSFTTAYAISKQFKSPWVKGGIWAVGAITPVSRLWAGAHWLSDVTMGVVLSVATVECIEKYLNHERNYDPVVAKKKISWNLNFTSRTIGVVGVF